MVVSKYVQIGLRHIQSPKCTTVRSRKYQPFSGTAPNADASELGRFYLGQFGYGAPMRAPPNYWEFMGNFEAFERNFQKFSRISAWLFCLLSACLYPNGPRRQLTREMWANTRRERKMRKCRKFEIELKPSQNTSHSPELSCDRWERKAAACTTRTP